MTKELSFHMAERDDVNTILRFINGLAAYEHMEDEVVATPELLEEWLFDKQKAEVLFALADGKEKLAEIAVTRGCGRLEWSCLDWNQPSIDFYLSLGAKRMDEWTVYRLTGETLQALGRE